MKTVRKYDYDAIWQKHLETGYNARQLSELVFPDIPVPSIYAILVKMRKKLPDQHPHSKNKVN